MTKSKSDGPEQDWMKELLQGLSEPEIRDLYDLMCEGPEFADPPEDEDPEVEALMSLDSLRLTQIETLLQALEDERSETTRLRVHATMLARQLADAQVRTIGQAQLLQNLPPLPNPDD